MQNIIKLYFVSEEVLDDINCRGHLDSVAAAHLGIMNDLGFPSRNISDFYILQVNNGLKSGF